MPFKNFVQGEEERPAIVTSFCLIDMWEGLGEAPHEEGGRTLSGSHLANWSNESDTSFPTDHCPERVKTVAPIHQDHHRKILEVF